MRPGSEGRAPVPELACPVIPAVIPAVILAGGAGRRMGGADKAALLLAGQPLLAHVLRRIGGQGVGPVAVSGLTLPAGLDAGPALPLLADEHADRRGPLAGILAGLRWAAALSPPSPFLLSLPCDCPFLPRDLVLRLRQAAEATDPPGARPRILLARSAGAVHPTVGLWDTALADDLAAVVVAAEDLSIRRFCRRYPHAECEIPSAGGIDPFFNVNTPADLARAENALRMGEDLEPILPRDGDEGEAAGFRLA